MSPDVVFGAVIFMAVLFVIVTLVHGAAEERDRERTREEAKSEEKVSSVPKPPARPSRITKENMKRLALVSCVFVLYCLLFNKYFNDGVEALVGALPATALTVFVYKQIARKANLES